MKYLNLILGTILAWFDNKWFTLMFALLLSIVAFFCADPAPGVPTANVAVFSLAVGVLTVMVLLFGTSIVKKSVYNWASFGCAIVGSIVGVLIALIINTFV